MAQGALDGHFAPGFDEGEVVAPEPHPPVCAEVAAGELRMFYCELFYLAHYRTSFDLRLTLLS